MSKYGLILIWRDANGMEYELEGTCKTKRARKKDIAQFREVMTEYDITQYGIFDEKGEELE